MAATTDPFASWLTQAQIPEARLTPEQHHLLQAAWRFRLNQGDDYYSTRVLSHFLLHCGSGLKVAALARLLGLSRPTASRQQTLSSKEAIRQAHHRMDGRPYGKLLPRYAGPIAEFLFTHPQASRADLLAFIDRTFAVRVSRVALSKFLKKFGLDDHSRQTAAAVPAPSAERTTGADPAPSGQRTPLPAVADPGPALVRVLPPGAPFLLSGQPVPSPVPPFSAHGRSTPGPSCCWAQP